MVVPAAAGVGACPRLTVDRSDINEIADANRNPNRARLVVSRGDMGSISIGASALWKLRLTRARAMHPTRTPDPSPRCGTYRSPSRNF
jgi:hypothetical protein